MLDTLIKSLQIKMTYRVNTIIYAIKQIPILKSIFSDKLYSLAWLKALLTVISIFREIIGKGKNCIVCLIIKNVKKI